MHTALTSITICAQESKKNICSCFAHPPVRIGFITYHKELDTPVVSLPHAHLILLITSKSCWITIWTRHEPVSHNRQIRKALKTLTDSVIMPYEFHDFFKDFGKPQCLLVVDKSTAITTVLFHLFQTDSNDNHVFCRERTKISMFQFQSTWNSNWKRKF